MRIRHLVAEVDEHHEDATSAIDDGVTESQPTVDGGSVAASRRNFVRRLGVTGAATLGAATVPGVLFQGVAAAQTAPDEGTSSDPSTGAATDPATGSTTDSTDDPTGPGQAQGTDPSDPVPADAARGGDATTAEGPEVLSAPVDEGLSDHDRKILEFQQGLELALVATYDLAIATRLLDPPDEETCRAFARHHHEHATALGALGEKDDTVTEPDQKLLGSLTSKVTSAADRDALLGVLREMEDSTAATYLEAIGTIDAWWVAGRASKILPIEAQHATVLGQSLGLAEDKWLPAVQKTDDAFDQFKLAR